MTTETDRQPVDEALDRAAKLYETYLELTTLLPADFDESNPADEPGTTPAPLGLRLTPAPVGIVIT